jgi:hypothetical protein
MPQSNFQEREEDEEDPPCRRPSATTNQSWTHTGREKEGKGERLSSDGEECSAAVAVKRSPVGGSVEPAAAAVA